MRAVCELLEQRPVARPSLNFHVPRTPPFAYSHQTSLHCSYCLFLAPVVLWPCVEDGFVQFQAHPDHPERQGLCRHCALQNTAQDAHRCASRLCYQSHSVRAPPKPPGRVLNCRPSVTPTAPLWPSSSVGFILTRLVSSTCARSSSRSRHSTISSLKS